MGLRGHRVGLIFNMDYYNKLVIYFINKGFCPAMARDISVDPRFMDLLMDCLCKVMTLMHHIIRSSMLLEVRYV